MTDVGNFRVTSVLAGNPDHLATYTRSGITVSCLFNSSEFLYNWRLKRVRDKLRRRWDIMYGTTDGNN